MGDRGCAPCILGCVQRNFASDYVVHQLALGFRRRPVCSKPGWRIGCADWVRNTASSVAPFEGEVVLEMIRLWTALDSLGFPNGVPIETNHAPAPLFDLDLERKRRK